MWNVEYIPQNKSDTWYVVCNSKCMWHYEGDYYVVPRVTNQEYEKAGIQEIAGTIQRKVKSLPEALGSLFKVQGHVWTRQTM